MAEPYFLYIIQNISAVKKANLKESLLTYKTSVIMLEERKQGKSHKQRSL